MRYKITRNMERRQAYGKPAWGVKGSDAAAILEYVGGQAVEITNIRTPVESRGGGHASKLLRAICNAADRHAIILQLFVEADEADGPDTATLKKWYRSHGFRPTGKKTWMERTPAGWND